MEWISSIIKRVAKERLGESKGCRLNSRKVGGGEGRFKTQLRRDEHFKTWKEKKKKDENEKKKIYSKIW